MEVIFERMNRVEQAIKTINRICLLRVISCLTIFFDFTTMNAQTIGQTCQKSITILQQAVLTGETFFIKVHAAENLIRHGKTEGLEVKFLQLQKASPDNLIGSARVLARLNNADPATYQQYISQLLEQSLQGIDAKITLTAMESLAKLGYHSESPVIRAYADTSTDGFKGMARWILANSNKNADEDRLSELLLSEQEIDYRYAAYALRFLKTKNPTTITRLKGCLQRLATNDAARVYVASCLFVHGGEQDRQTAIPILKQYASGDIGQRYEVAEAFGLGGNNSQVPALQKLLADENTDVRVAAANALLLVLTCKP